MDEYINCLLSICCPPMSQTQHDAMTKFLIAEGIDANAAESCAKVIYRHFDLAPQGTLQPFKDAIAKLARGADYKE